MKYLVLLLKKKAKNNFIIICDNAELNSKKIADKHYNISRKDINHCCSIILESIVDGVKNGSRYELRGLGSFFSKTFKSKVGRNPKTGEVLVLAPGRKTIRFRASKILLKRLNKNFTENKISANN